MIRKSRCSVVMASGRLATLGGMWQVTIVCSSCAEESEVGVEDLEEVEREACACGYCFVVLSVAEFEPVEIAGGQVVELRRRNDGRLAA